MGGKFLTSYQDFAAIFCTATIGVFLIGTASLSAQLFLSCMERYNVGRKEAALPFTLIYIFRNLPGPLTGYLGRRYGAQIITEIGCIICAIGIGGCFFAEDITAVSILWGCVYGVGCGFGTLLLPSILQEFFDEHYDKAHGIFMAGNGVGNFLLPLLSEVLLKEYGTSGTFLVLGGLALNSFPVSLVLRFSKKSSAKVKSRQRTDLEVNHALLSSAEDKDSFKPIELTNVADEREQGITVSGKVSDTRKFPVSVIINEQSENDKTFEELKLINTYQCSVRAGDGCPKNSEIKNTHQTNAVSNEKHLESPVVNPKGFLDAMSIFIDPAFILILVTQSFSVFNLLTWYTIVIDFARDVGVNPNQEVYVLMSLTISDTMGRAFLGTITDRGYLSKHVFYAVSCVLLGIIMSIMTLIRGFLQNMITIFITGVLMGGLVMVNAGIVIPFIPKEKMIYAMPCRTFLYPAMGLAQPFLIDYFRQQQGSYNGLLWFMSILSLATAFMMMLLPSAKRLRENWESKKVRNKRTI